MLTDLAANRKKNLFLLFTLSTVLSMAMVMFMQYNMSVPLTGVTIEDLKNDDLAKIFVDIYRAAKNIVLPLALFSCLVSLFVARLPGANNNSVSMANKVFYASLGVLIIVFGLPKIFEICTSIGAEMERALTTGVRI